MEAVSDNPQNKFKNYDEKNKKTVKILIGGRP